MFVKQLKEKTGRIILVYAYGYRENGKVKHRNYETIGFLDELEKQYNDPIDHFKKEAKIKFKDFKPEEANRLLLDISKLADSDNTKKKSLGYLIIQKIYDEFNLDEVLNKVIKKTKVEYDICQALRLLVYSRILYPASKKETYENKDIYFDLFTDDTLEDLYRSLTVLNDNKDLIVDTIFNNTTDKYKRDLSTTYYDCTNYYFEINYNDEDLLDEEGNVIEKGFRKRGPEKNHRPDPIVEMGLLLDSNYIPVTYSLFPGNDSEKTSLRPNIKKIKSKYNVTKTVVVADRGLNTSDNTFFLAGKNTSNDKNNDGYVYGQTIKGANEEFISWALDKNGYIEDHVSDGEDTIKFVHKSRVVNKELKIKKDGKRKIKTHTFQKQMVYYSEKYAQRQKKQRELMVEKAKDLISNPGKYTKATSYGACNYIKNINFNKDTGEITNKNLELDTDLIKDEERFDGYYSIVTSEIDYDDKKIRDIYSNLWKIEDTFKVSKSILNSRPVRVWTKDHIEGHFLTCYISLVIISLLRIKTNNKYSQDKLVDSLRKYECAYLQDNYYVRTYYSETIKELNKLFDLQKLDKKYILEKTIKKYL